MNKNIFVLSPELITTLQNFSKEELGKVEMYIEDIEKDSRKRKGKYWLSKEGREELRSIWNNNEESVLITLLNEVERLENINPTKKPSKDCEDFYVQVLLLSQSFSKEEPFCLFYKALEDYQGLSYDKTINHHISFPFPFPFTFNGKKKYYL